MVLEGVLRYELSGEGEVVPVPTLYKYVDGRG